MRLVKLTIENFMSIGLITIKFKLDKAYAIQGPNDHGKSNILRAIDALCNNVNSRELKNLIRDYADGFKIIGEFEFGHVITLSRGAENYYSMVYPDGQKFFTDKLESTVPGVIQDVLNLYVDEKTKEKLNFRYSDDKLIMVNTTDGENYHIFQHALKTEECANGIKRLNEEDKEFKGRKDSLEGRLIEETIDSNNIPDYDLTEKELRGFESNIDALFNEISMLSDYLGGIAYVRDTEAKSYPREILDYDEKKDAEILSSIKLLGQLIVGLSEENRLELSLEKKRKVLEVAENHNDRDLRILKAVDNVVNLYDACERLETSVVARKEVLSAYQQVAATYQTTSLLAECTSLFNVEKRLEQSISDKKNIVATFEDMKVRDDIQMLHTFLQSLQVTKEYSRNVKAKKMELETMTNKMQLFMTDNSFCSIVAQTGSCPFDKFKAG